MSSGRLSRIAQTLFNTSVAQNSRLPWVDYAKGVAIILVAYRHVLIGFERSGLQVQSYLLQANEIFFSFRMPLFFILSGVFISKSLAKRSAQSLIRNKAQTLLYPYIVWALIQITLQIIFSKYTNADRGLKSYSYILLQPDALDQLWYLFALFNVTICYVLLKVLLKVPPFVQLLLGLICYYLSTIFNSGPQHDLLYYYQFYALGDFISAYMLNKDLYKYYRSPVVFIIILPFFVVSQWYFLKNEAIQSTNIYLFALIALIGCVFMLNICFMLQQWGRLQFLKVVGYYSLYIYVMHVMIVSFFRSFFVDVVGITFVPLLLVMNLTLGIALSIILYNLALRAGLWFLFTLDKARVKLPGPKFSLKSRRTLVPRPEYAPHSLSSSNSDER